MAWRCQASDRGCALRGDPPAWRALGEAEAAHDTGLKRDMRRSAFGDRPVIGPLKGEHRWAAATLALPIRLRCCSAISLTPAQRQST